MAKKRAKTKTKSAANMFSAAALELAASAVNLVTFTCTSTVCLVSIQLGLLKTTFVGSGAMNMPQGSHLITYQVQGPAGTAFTLTATGATMTPINDTASTAGLQPITVP